PPRSGEGSPDTAAAAMGTGISPSPLRGGGRGEGFSLADPRLAQWGDSPEAIALAFAEAAKARALSDLLRERPVAQAAPRGWVAEEERLGEEAARLYAELRALGREPGEPGRRLRERIQALELERDILEVRIKRAAPRAMLPSPLRSVAEIQALLEPDTALLEYALLPDAGVQAFGRSGVQGEKDLPSPERPNARTPERLNTERLALWIVT